MRRKAALLLSTGILVGSSGIPAMAGTPATCIHDGVSTAAITLATAATMTVSRNIDAIYVDGAPCGAATVTNTDTITVDAPNGSVLVIDLSGGAFAPGITDEGDGSSEIELSEVGSGDLDTVRVTGGSGAEHLVTATTTILSVSYAAVNLNADETTDDFDLTFDRGVATDVQLVGNDGFDELSVGVPTPVLYPATLEGGAGDDTLRFFADGGSIDGGGGTDLLDESGGDAITILEMASLVVGLGPGETPMSNVENAKGGSSDDFLFGDLGPNVLEGGDGNDTLIGAGGGDTLDGGAGPYSDSMSPGVGQDEVIGDIGGLDALYYDDASAGVSVNLLTGTATGDGDDILTGEFLGVFGSPFDDVLTGDEKPNAIDGGDGADNLRGDAGADSVDGGTGNDVVGGGLGSDTLQGGDGRDVLVGKEGDDVYDGGAGVDEAEFLTAKRRMTVDLKAGTARGQGQDQLSDIERVDGGPKGDTIRGDGANNDLDGFGGADRLFGRGGNDRLSGGGASDRCDGGPGSGDQAQKCEVVTGVP
jgi:Ca2+-binding RTX toxin-like protein